jgi:hypothetical protein
MQRDPIEYTSGDRNLYRYVQNGPPNWIDASGLEVKLPKPPPKELTLPLKLIRNPILAPIGIAAAEVAIITNAGGSADYIAELTEGISAEELRKPVTQEMLKRLPKDIRIDVDIDKDCVRKKWCKVDDGPGTPGPYWFLENQDKVLIEKGREFTNTQRVKIQAVNFFRHNPPRFESDDPKDPLKGTELARPVLKLAGESKTKNERGQKIEAQVDHIKPRKDGGSNSYCNAQVVSMEFNELKEAGKV